MYEGIQRHEKQSADLMQASFGRVMGAHLIPVHDPTTGKIRLPETFAEVQSLLPAIARPEYLASLGEMLKEIDTQEKLDRGELADLTEVDGAPPLDTDTSMELLDWGSGDARAQWQQLNPDDQKAALAAAGVQVMDGTARPQEEPEEPRPVRGSFVLDD